MFISLKPFAALLLFCASCASTPAARQAPDAPAAPEQEAPDALPADVRSAMQAAEPGPEHAMLAKLAGGCIAVPQALQALEIAAVLELE